MKTLAQQVDALACKCIVLEGLVGEIIATIKLNHERGYLVAVNDEGKLELAKIVKNWASELDRIQLYGE